MKHNRSEIIDRVERQLTDAWKKTAKYSAKYLRVKERPTPDNAYNKMMLWSVAQTWQEQAKNFERILKNR